MEKQEWGCPGFSGKSTDHFQSVSQKDPQTRWLLCLDALIGRCCHGCWVLFLVTSWIILQPEIHPCQPASLQNRQYFRTESHCPKDPSAWKKQVSSYSEPFLWNSLSAKPQKLSSVFFPTCKQHTLSGSGTAIARDHRDEQPHNCRCSLCTGRPFCQKCIWRWACPHSLPRERVRFDDSFSS